MVRRKTDYIINTCMESFTTFLYRYAGWKKIGRKTRRMLMERLQEELEETLNLTYSEENIDPAKIDIAQTLNRMRGVMGAVKDAFNLAEVRAETPDEEFEILTKREETFERIKSIFNDLIWNKYQQSGIETEVIETPRRRAIKGCTIKNGKIKFR